VPIARNSVEMDCGEGEQATSPSNRVHSDP
jgi:hypothetical protein